MQTASEIVVDFVNVDTQPQGRMMAQGCMREGSFRYSPIEHLAKTLWSSDSWPTGRLLMLTACFDASGSDHDQSALVVAGFVSSANDWMDFEKEWVPRLAQDGIKYFRMAEFAHSRAQFEGWETQEPRRRSLFADLLDIISRHAYRKFGCGISIKNWSSLISPKNITEFRINAYCIAGMVSTDSVDSWALRERIAMPIEVVFEDGDLGKGTLQNYLSPRKPDPLFRPKNDTLRKDGMVVPAFVPLQAADLLAYELFVGIRNYENSVDRPARYGLEHFYKMPGEIKYLQPKDLSNLDGMLRGIAALLP